MEVNKTFDIRVRCTNKQLLEYIKSSLKNGNEIIPGLEFISFVDHDSLHEETPIVKTISVKPIHDSEPIHNSDISLNQHCKITKPSAEKRKYYNGEWIDMTNKSAVQNMFDSIIM